MHRSRPITNSKGWGPYEPAPIPPITHERGSRPDIPGPLAGP